MHILIFLKNYQLGTRNRDFWPYLGLNFFFVLAQYKLRFLVVLLFADLLSLQHATHKGHPFVFQRQAGLSWKEADRSFDCWEWCRMQWIWLICRCLVVNKPIPWLLCCSSESDACITGMSRYLTKGAEAYKKTRWSMRSRFIYSRRYTVNPVWGDKMWNNNHCAISYVFRWWSCLS